MSDIRRREFIALLGGSAAAWPRAAWAEQERVRRIGVLMNTHADDPVGRGRVAAFQQALQGLGWIEPRRIRIDYRWGGEPLGSGASELIKLEADVIVVAGSSNLASVQRETRTLPIVFALVTDPVGSGFVATLARPGGNTTGFTTFEYSMSGKWLELLKQCAPAMRRAGVLRNPAISSGIGQFSAIQSAAASLSVELSPIDVRDISEIERAVAAFAHAPNGGLIVTSSALTMTHRDLIVGLAARHRLPAIYPYPVFTKSGGLISYGPDTTDPFRRAAGYVDRILRGEKPADLPVQAPTKYELIINMKTARALGLEVPPTLLAIADEVIE
jgi:putative ABC transport system substrate-binding protein